MRGYKLFRERKDGTLGSLFINRMSKIPLGVWLTAETYPTKGYAIRKGWHITIAPVAPHLSKKGRAWYTVEFENYNIFDRPEYQGGRWFIAERMKVLNRYER